MKRKNGFTLVEILAVLTVLALILGIIIPSVTNAIDSSKKNTAKLSIEIYAHAIENAVAVYMSNNMGDVPGGLEDLELSGKNFEKILTPNAVFNEKGKLLKVTASIDKFNCVYEVGKETTCN